MSNRAESYLAGLVGETAHASRVITDLDSNPEQMRSHFVELVAAEGIAA